MYVCVCVDGLGGGAFKYENGQPFSFPVMIVAPWSRVTQAVAITGEGNKLKDLHVTHRRCVTGTSFVLSTKASLSLPRTAKMFIFVNFLDSIKVINVKLCTVTTLFQLCHS